MSADLVIEEERKKLTLLEVENMKQKAEAKGFEISNILQHYKDVDWKILMAMNTSGNSAQQHIALAFRQLAENAQKIGTLNITPDLLQSLTNNTSTETIYNQNNEQEYR
jgi:hypothetical protein